MTPHGTDSTTTSAAAAPEGWSTVAPISAAKAASLAWSRAKLTVTSWPARVSRRATLPPILPAPMMPMRMGRLDAPLAGYAVSLNSKYTYLSCQAEVHDGAARHGSAGPDRPGAGLVGARASRPQGPAGRRGDARQPAGRPLPGRAGRGVCRVRPVQPVL